MKKYALIALIVLLPFAAMAEDAEKLTLEKTVLELQIQNMELQVENMTFRAKEQYQILVKRLDEIKTKLAEKKEEK